MLASTFRLGMRMRVGRDTAGTVACAAVGSAGAGAVPVGVQAVRATARARRPSARLMRHAPCPPIRWG
jgi:hypothetical protein